MKRLKPTTNNKYFKQIEKSPSKKELAYDKSQALARLVHTRTELVAETREKRQWIYKLSLEIHSIEQELVELFSEKS